MYKFPIIEHIDQVKDAIDGREEFIIAEREHYNVVNYLVRKEDTFPPIVDEKTAILRECRGLIFDKDGKLISRGFHKFFNVGEIEETQPENIDLSNPHVIQDKLDGSFIRPIMIGGYIRWASKMGITDVSMMAEEFIVSNPYKRYNQFAELCIYNGVTPIFEFCSRRQRIVIDYPKEDLVLLALRYNVTGEYLGMNYFSDVYNIPKVSEREIDDKANLYNIVKGMTGIEGFVISFDDGLKVKIKTEEYVCFHKAKDSINLEKNVIATIVNDKIDDLLGLLPKEDSERLHKFNKQFWENVAKTEEELKSIYEKSYVIDCEKDRKKFATVVAPTISPLYRSALFGMMDGKQPLDCLLSLMQKNVGSSTSIDRIRPLWGNLKWNHMS